MVYQFRTLSRCWYGKDSLRSLRLVEKITFGSYPIGWECSIVWQGDCAPFLRIYPDSVGWFAEYYTFLEDYRKLCANGHHPTVEEVEQLLQRHKFEDCSEKTAPFSTELTHEEKLKKTLHRLLYLLSEQWEDRLDIYVELCEESSDFADACRLIGLDPTDVSEPPR